MNTLDKVDQTLGLGSSIADQIDAQIDKIENFYKEPTMNTTATLLAERGKTHGDFADHARITQSLKSILLKEYAARKQRGQEPLTAEQRESLDMIAHKIGRIIAGQADFPDHWDDIAGYAKLPAKEG